MQSIGNFGGWRLNRNMGTGDAWTPPVGVSVSILFASMLAATGSDISLEQWEKISSPPPIIQPSMVDVVSERTPLEDLQRVFDFFSPSTVQLASTLGVVRQAIYQWRNGDTNISGENAGKLRDLALAADMLSHSGVVSSPALLKRKFVNGKGLFQVAQEGGSVSAAAQIVVNTIRRENVQRKRMQELYSKRSINKATSDFDFAAANDLS